MAQGHRVMCKYLFEGSRASWGHLGRILSPENALFFFLSTHGIAAWRPLNPLLNRPTTHMIAIPNDDDEFADDVQCVCVTYTPTGSTASQGNISVKKL